LKKELARVSWVIEVKNEDTVSREINIYDNIPNSELEGVKVTLTDDCDKPTTQTKDGILTWQVTLKAGEQKKIRFEYEISVPKNMNMNMPQ